MARFSNGPIENHLVDDEVLRRSVHASPVQSNLNPAEKPNLDKLKGLFSQENDIDEPAPEPSAQQAPLSAPAAPAAPAAQPAQNPVDPQPPPTPGQFPPGMTHPYFSPPQKPSPRPPKEIVFENAGVKFKVVNGVVFKEDWVEVDPSQFRVTKLSGKGERVIPSEEIKVEKKDWVELKND